MSKHTPGPWKHNLIANSYGENGAFAVVRDTQEAEQTLVCHMPYSGIKSSHISERKANARLIAAAPELLEALEPFAEQAKHRVADAPEWDNKDTVNISVKIGELRAVVAAIAKAKGGSND